MRRARLDADELVERRCASLCHRLGRLAIGRNSRSLGRKHSGLRKRSRSSVRAPEAVAVGSLRERRGVRQSPASHRRRTRARTRSSRHRTERSTAREAAARAAIGIDVGGAPAPGESCRAIGGVGGSMFSRVIPHRIAKLTPLRARLGLVQALLKRPARSPAPFFSQNRGWS